MPRPRVIAGVDVGADAPGATTVNSAVFVLNGAQALGALNGAKPAFGLTEANPSFATAICGPSAIPHGCRRLVDTAAVCPPGIAVDPGSLPFTASPSQVT